MPDDIEPLPGMELTPARHEGLQRGEAMIPATGDGPPVRVVLYRWQDTSEHAPVILSLHGGGFRLRPDHFPAFDASLAALGALVVAVDYRGLPDDPYPAAVDDCSAALEWVAAHRPGATPRIGIVGVSAGGALAAATAIRAKDRHGPRVDHLTLITPALDDRCSTRSVIDADPSAYPSRDDLSEMWDEYLFALDVGDVPWDAAPARCSDLRGLPSTFIQVNACDPLRDEGMAFAVDLMNHDVDVELYCAPGQPHGMPGEPRGARQAWRLVRSAISAGLGLGHDEQSRASH